VDDVGIAWTDAANDQTCRAACGHGGEVARHVHKKSEAQSPGAIHRATKSTTFTALL
jgi:hypothetical protein